MPTGRPVGSADAGNDRYRWDFYGSPAEHTRVRSEAGRQFVDDLRTRPERYVAAALPRLPFDSERFRLILSSHFLFTYADRFDEAFHRAALIELARVSRGEVRIFPLLDQAGGDCTALVAQLRAELAARGTESEVRTVDYEFQRGGSQMLVLNAAG